MADVLACAETVLQVLRAVPGVTVYDGHVPVKVPETDGFPDPYIVLWAGTGDGPGELPADGRQADDSLVWDFQTTAVGADASICRAVDLQVQAKLTNLRVGTGLVRRNPDGFNQQAPVLDTQTTPSRMFLPRQWRLITN